VVIEAGAWADNSSFAGVVRRLQYDGYTVDVPPNPLQSLTYDSQTLAGFLSTISGPIVLVGHSYGGMVITNAATGNPNVKALVYVDAYIPAQGDTLQSLTGAQPGSCLAVKDPTMVFTFAPIPVRLQATSTPTSSRAYSPPASPMACPPVKPPCWPLPSARWRPAR
jgi:pimeloyl-ACP methyl ester carboxylesterase